jgi:hypothetical protein
MFTPPRSSRWLLLALLAFGALSSCATGPAATSLAATPTPTLPLLTQYCGKVQKVVALDDPSLAPDNPRQFEADVVLTTDCTSIPSTSTGQSAVFITKVLRAQMLLTVALQGGFVAECQGFVTDKGETYCEAVGLFNHR